MSSGKTADEVHLVWLDDRSRIASFHPVEGYTRLEFLSHEAFMAFLQSLKDRCFSFQ